MSVSTTVIYSGHKYSIWAGLSRDNYLHYMVSAGTAKIGARRSISKMAHSQDGVGFHLGSQLLCGPWFLLMECLCFLNHGGPVPRESLKPRSYLSVGEVSKPRWKKRACGIRDIMADNFWKSLSVLIVTYKNGSIFKTIW